MNNKISPTVSTLTYYHVAITEIQTTFEVLENGQRQRIASCETHEFNAYEWSGRGGEGDLICDFYLSEKYLWL
jgi:hypothetical protein